MLSASRHALAASSGSCTGGSALGSERSLASVAMMTDATGVCCGLPGGGSSTSDGVSGSGLRDASGLCRLLACQAGQETWLAAGGACVSGSCASAGHDDGLCWSWTLEYVSEVSVCRCKMLLWNGRNET